MLMSAAVLFPMVSGTVLLASRCKSRAVRERVVMTVSVVTALLALLAVFLENGQRTVLVWFNRDLSLAFCLDGLGEIFAVMVSVLWVLASVYALEYMKHEGNETRFFGFFLMSFGVTLASPLQATSSPCTSFTSCSPWPPCLW